MKRSVSKLAKAYAVNLGAWIRETREGLGLSQEQFGEKVGAGRNTIFHWERGMTMPNVYQYSLIRRLVNKTEAVQ